MVAYCGRILGSSTDAEDAAQEGFAAAFTSLQHRRGPTRFRLWLYRTAHNHCVSELRRRATRAPETILHTDSARWEPADQSPAPADRAAQREDVRRIFRDLRTLPSTQRTALVLREFESLSYEQVADELQTSVPSVKALLLRARATLAHSADDRERDRVTGFVPGVMGIFAGARETVARLVSGGALESLSVPGASPASALSKVALALAAVALTSSAAPVIQHRHPQRPGGTVETARPARAATAPAVTTLSVGHRHVDPVPAARSRPRRTRPPATAPQR